VKSSTKSSGLIIVYNSLAMLTVAVPSAGAQDAFRVIGVGPGDVLNVRSSPSASASIAGTIPPDAAKVSRTGDCKTWCRVRYGDVEGWVDRRFLTADVTPTASGPVAQPIDPYAECNKHGGPNKVRGCTELIEQKEFRKEELAVVHSRRSDAYLASGDLNAAIADRVKSLDLQPESTVYKRRLSELYVLQARASNDSDQSAKSFDLATKTDPTNHAVYLERSVKNIAQKKFDVALEDLKRGKELAPADERYANLLSMLFGLRGASRMNGTEVDGAIADFTEGLQLEPNNASLLMNRGKAYHAKNANRDALRDFSRALILEPENNETFFHRAELHYTQERYEQALSDLTEILKRDPKHIDALMLRGLVYEATEKTAQAGKDYNEILRLLPTHKLARASLERLKGLTTTSSPITPKDFSDLDEKERITLLQRELKRVGCDPGEIDGEFGENTANALALFVEHTGLVLNTAEPSAAALVAVSSHNDRVCPGSSVEQAVTDGRWTGDWGGRSSATVLISNGKVIRYRYRGREVPVTESAVSGNTLTFGSNTYTIQITFESARTASAYYRHHFNGNASSATLTRQYPR
jgi:tetratricopeptide (TPR) repeat protein